MSRPNVINNTPRVTDPVFPGANAHQGNVSFTQDIHREALVISVIVNEESEGYSSDGYNVGGIKFRFIKTDFYTDESTLQNAFPAEANIQEYPLKNEIVLVFRSLNRWYYTRKLNITNKITEHSVFGLSAELGPISGTSGTSNNINSAKVTGARKTSTPIASNVLGEYFKANSGIRRLRHQEGDLIVEGRSGHSIRFGINRQNLSPNLLLRVGQGLDVKPNINSPYSLVIEDINKDSSSIYIVSDEVVKLKYATLNSKKHFKSIVDAPDVLGGNQVIINSDRIVFNSKKDKIMGFSSNGIHWTTNKDFTIDADKDFRSNVVRHSQMETGGFWESLAGKRHSLSSPKVYVGSIQNEAEPMVCGAQLAKFLDDFLNVFIKNAATIVAATGPTFSPSPLNPAVIVGLGKLKGDVSKGKYASFNSKVGYTVKDFKKESSSPIFNSSSDPSKQEAIKEQEKSSILKEKQIASSSLKEERSGILKENQMIADSLNMANSLIVKQTQDLAKEQVSTNVQMALISSANIAFITPIQSKLTTAAAFKLITENKLKLNKAVQRLNEVKVAMAESVAELQSKVVNAQSVLNDTIAFAENQASSVVDSAQKQLTASMSKLQSRIEIQADDELKNTKFYI